MYFLLKTEPKNRMKGVRRLSVSIVVFAVFSLISTTVWSTICAPCTTAITLYLNLYLLGVPFDHRSNASHLNLKDRKQQQQKCLTVLSNLCCVDNKEFSGSLCGYKLNEMMRACVFYFSSFFWLHLLHFILRGARAVWTWYICFTHIKTMYFLFC